MEFRVIHHFEPKKKLKLFNAHQFNLLLRGMVLSYVDTLFITTMNDQREIYNLLLFPCKGIKSFKNQLSRIGVINAYESTAYNSIAFNIIPRVQH
ncbi:MAG: hypothetical protein B6226_06205 [Candidatus Cloacimonetes bacterium 4572_65]|nr:MAG: hypothetical protein B6226_06205 [Candidatus Cloacimonetes bacterium 4572_65]